MIESETGIFRFIDAMHFSIEYNVPYSCQGQECRYINYIKDIMRTNIRHTKLLPEDIKTQIINSIGINDAVGHHDPTHMIRNRLSSIEFDVGMLPAKIYNEVIKKLDILDFQLLTEAIGENISTDFNNEL